MSHSFITNDGLDFTTPHGIFTTRTAVGPGVYRDVKYRHGTLPHSHHHCSPQPFLILFKEKNLKNFVRKPKVYDDFRIIFVERSRQWWMGMSNGFYDLPVSDTWSIMYFSLSRQSLRAMPCQWDLSDGTRYFPVPIYYTVCVDNPFDPFLWKWPAAQMRSEGRGRRHLGCKQVQQPFITTSGLDRMSWIESALVEGNNRYCLNWLPRGFTG